MKRATEKTTQDPERVLALALELEQRGNVRVCTKRKGVRQIESMAAELRAAEDLLGQAVIIVHRIDEEGRHIRAWVAGREPGVPIEQRHSAMQQARRERLQHAAREARRQESAARRAGRS